MKIRDRTDVVCLARACDARAVASIPTALEHPSLILSVWQLWLESIRLAKLWCGG
jgi:hypothetical protein